MGLARKAAIWTNVVFDEVVFQGGLDWALSTYGVEFRHNQILGVCSDSLISRYIEIFSQTITYKNLLRQTYLCSYQAAHYVFFNRRYSLLSSCLPQLLIRRLCHSPIQYVAMTKAELLQLNCTQFPSLGIFVSKKVGNRKN